MSLGHYEPTLVVVSILVAVYASYDSRLGYRSRILAASLATSAERQTLYLHEQKARVEAERLSKPVTPAELVRAVMTLCDNRLTKPVPASKQR